jgi:hypothetical protein
VATSRPGQSQLENGSIPASGKRRWPLGRCSMMQMLFIKMQTFGKFALLAYVEGGYRAEIAHDAGPHFATGTQCRVELGSRINLAWDDILFSC